MIPEGRETAYGDTYWLDIYGKWRYAVNGKEVKNAVKLKQADGTYTILAAELLPDRLLTLSGVAEYIGVVYSTIRTYKAKGLLPDPVITIEATPFWTKPIIKAWNAKRPGQGQGARHRLSNSPYSVWLRTKKAS